MKHKYLIAAFFIFVTISKAQELVPVINYIANVNRGCIDGNILYFSLDDSIAWIDITSPSPSPTTLINGIGIVGGLEVKDNYLYCSIFDDEKIIKIDLNAPTPTTQLVTDIGVSPNMITFDGDVLYCSDNNGYAIFTFNIVEDGAVPEIVVEDGNPPVGIAIKDNYLYYSVPPGGRIFRKDMTLPSLEGEEILSGLGWILDIEFKGNELFIADHWGGIKKINVNDNPPVPEIVVANGDGPIDLMFAGEVLYVIQNSKISKIDLSLSVDEFSENDEILVLPNPSENYIQLLNNQTSLKYSIYDLHGRELANGISMQEQKIDVSFLPSGPYYIGLLDHNKWIKFLKK